MMKMKRFDNRIVPMQWVDRIKGYRRAKQQGNVAGATEQLAHLERIARKLTRHGILLSVPDDFPEVEQLVGQARLGYVG